MPLPPVVVEMGDTQLTPELRQTLLRACTRSVEDGECVDAEESTAAAPRAVAILSWSDDGSVRIQVGLREPPRWRTRVLRFAQDDEPEEICTAVGFAAGTLATTLDLGGEGEEGAGPPGEDPAPDASPANAAPAVPARPAAEVAAAAAATSAPASAKAAGTERAERRPRLTADVAVMGGTGVEPDAARLGPRAMVTLWGDLPWSLSLRGDVAWVVRAPLGMSYRVVGGAIGPGGYVSLGDARLTLRALIGADSIHAQVSDPVTGRDDGGGRWLGAVAVGGDIEWPCTSPARAVIGGEAAWPFGTTEVRVAGVPRDTAARVHGAGTIGIRIGATCLRR